MNNSTIFHLAIPINDIQQAKTFYCDRLGCEAGRETDKALILNVYGHQVVAHITDEPLIKQKGIYPRHFGLIFLEEAHWQALAERVKAQGISFFIAPKWRFVGEITEHGTFFLEDPFSNYLEFKFYRHYEAIFGTKSFAAIGDRASR
ncbi:MAG: VOC family protein [Snowella sp.]|nr:VOC family protein [Snowella sp.]